MGTNFFLLLLGSGALATTVIKYPEEALIVGILIAAITAMKIAFGFAYRAAHRRHLWNLKEARLQIRVYPQNSSIGDLFP